MNIMKQEEFAIYHYGIQTGIELLICLSVSAILAYKFNIFAEFLVVLCLLLSLRGYSCGIHMGKFITCFFCSVVLVTSGPVLAQCITFPKRIMLFLCIGTMFPIHKHAFLTTRFHYDLQEVDYFAKQKKKIFICVILLLIIFFCGKYFRNDAAGSICIIYSVFFSYRRSYTYKDKAAERS